MQASGIILFKQVALPVVKSVLASLPLLEFGGCCLVLSAAAAWFVKQPAARVRQHMHAHTSTEHIPTNTHTHAHIHTHMHTIKHTQLSHAHTHAHTYNKHTHTFTRVPACRSAKHAVMLACTHTSILAHIHAA